MSAVSRRNTVFSPMKDFGSLFQPNPLFMSSKMRSFPPRRLYVANDSHTWTVSEKLLVCEFRIILLCLYELMVEVNVIHSTFLQLPRRKQAIQEQCIQLVCRVEGIGFACVGCVRNIILGQFLYGSENSVGTTCAKCRVKREMAHQMRGDILYA